VRSRIVPGLELLASAAAIPALAALVFAASSCSTAATRIGPQPTGEARPIIRPPVSELEAELGRRDRALRSFQGQGRLEYEGPQDKVRSANMVVVKAPDKVRIDFRSPFSLTYSVMSDGVTLTAYDRGEKVLYEGKPSARNVGKYTRVPVEPRMLASLVRGIPPLPELAGSGTVRWADGGWLWEVPMKAGGTMSLLFDAFDLRPKEVRFDNSASLGGLKVYFEDYKPVGGVNVAHKVRAVLPDGGRVELDYEIIWRDREHEDNAFRIEPPKGVRVVDMEQDSRGAGS
jgi:outer membrane lipoprotein-sorting protein